MARNSDTSPLMAALTIGIGVLLIISLIGGVLAYKQVPEGHEGVTKQWGAVNGETLDSGAHFKVPIMEGVQNVETRPRTYTMTNTKGEGARKDADAVTVKTVNGSSVDVSITIRYSINDKEADTFVSRWNNEQQMEKRLIRPTVKNNLADEGSSLQTTGVGAIYTSEGRERLAETVETALRAEFENQPITLEAVQIRAIDLPKKIDQTLDEKEQAKQKVEVEQQRVKQEEARAEQKIVEARGDAKAIEIRGEALRENPVVLQDRMISAYDDGTVFVTDGDTPIIMDAGPRNNSTAAP